MTKKKPSKTFLPLPDNDGGEPPIPGDGFWFTDALDEGDREDALSILAGQTEITEGEVAHLKELFERLPGEEHLYREEKYAAKYEINMLRCIFCGLCEEACPKDAIYLSQTFAPANYGRKGFIYKKEELLIPHPVLEKEAYLKALGDKATNN